MVTLSSNYALNQALLKSFELLLNMSPAIAICFGQFGPYHHARVDALQRLASARGIRVLPIQIAESTSTYQWEVAYEGESNTSSKKKFCRGLLTLCTGTDEEASPVDVFLRARDLFGRLGVGLVFLPSYSPARFLALFAAAKSLGIRTVMMNESHAGTEKATGWKKWLKHQIVIHFDSAFVGGKPHKRHFSSLGIPLEKIFTGYDAIDNNFFISQTDKVRLQALKLGEAETGSTQPYSGFLDDEVVMDLRKVYGLPKRYFLSLGRMVEKKNLEALIEAYAKFSAKSRLKESERLNQDPVSLVFVGNGVLEGALWEKAISLGLQVISRHNTKAYQSDDFRFSGTTDMCECGTQHTSVFTGVKPHEQLPSSQNIINTGAVLFYGFRQIEENTIFYALAEAFVLPSLEEEWGLVVNEAMASALPVIVSRAAGCAEDLLPVSEMETQDEVLFPTTVAECNEYHDDSSLEKRSNGYLFDSSSVDSLATALWLIAESDERRLAMGKRSREIVEMFSCENFAYQALEAAIAALV